MIALNNKKDYIMMKYSTASKVLQKRAEWYGRSLSWLVSTIENELRDAGYANETVRVMQAYNVYIGSKVYANGS